MKKKAILIGATGLTGSHLLQQILVDTRFYSVVVFVRRTTGITHPKLIENIVDFEKPHEWLHMVQGDVVYLALGTTRAKAGGKTAQYMVDYSYQYRVASQAVRHNIPSIILVSSAGAALNSLFFYARMKAELERDIQKLNVKRLAIIRPGALAGPRKEDRSGERIGLGVLRLFNSIGLFKRFRPIHVEIVARAMINATFIEHAGTRMYELQEVFDLADGKQSG